MRPRIFLALVGACSSLVVPSTAHADHDRPVAVRIVHKVCDRWTHATEPMRGTDLLKVRVVRVEGLNMRITAFGKARNRAYGYRSNVGFTLWSPSAKHLARARLRFVSIDGRCHRIGVRYELTRYPAGESPYG